MVCDRSRSLDGWRGRTWEARRSLIDMVAIVAPAGGRPSAAREHEQGLVFRPVRTDYTNRNTRPTHVGRARSGRIDVLCCGKRTFNSVRPGTRPLRKSTRLNSSHANISY